MKLTSKHHIRDAKPEPGYPIWWDSRHLTGFAVCRADLATIATECGQTLEWVLAAPSESRRVMGCKSFGYRAEHMAGHRHNSQTLGEYLEASGGDVVVITMAAPTDPGWYWYRRNGLEPVVVHVGRKSGGGLSVKMPFSRRNYTIRECAREGAWLSGALAVPGTHTIGERPSEAGARRPFADDSTADLMRAVHTCARSVCIVKLAELLRRDDVPPDLGWVRDFMARECAAFTGRRALSVWERVGGFRDPIVELAEHEAGLLRYGKSEDPEHYSVALRLDKAGTKWHGFRIDRNPFSFADLGAKVARVAAGDTPSEAECERAANAALREPS